MSIANLPANMSFLFKVVLWGCPVGMVCTTMMSLLSLLPGIITDDLFFYFGMKLNKVFNASGIWF